MDVGIIDLTDATFDAELARSSEPVMVDFWAEWCGPCRQMAPVLEEIATEQAGRVRIAKLNVDEHPDAAVRYGVLSLPTFIVFRAGQPAKRLVGAKSKQALLNELNAVL